MRFHVSDKENCEEFYEIKEKKDRKMQNQDGGEDNIKDEESNHDKIREEKGKRKIFEEGT